MTGQADSHNAKIDKAKVELAATEADFYAARKETNVCVRNLNEATKNEQAMYRTYLVALKALRALKASDTGVLA